MATRTSRRSRKGKSSRRVSKRRSSKRSKRRSGKRPSRRSGRKAKISVKKISTFLPDVAVTKMKASFLSLTVPCIDTTTPSAFNPFALPPTGNILAVSLNSDPNGGPVVYTGANFGTAIYNPVRTFVTKYTRYRCHAAKIRLEFIYADNSTNAAELSTVAKPFIVTGFPFQLSQPLGANFWDGTSAVATYTATNIPGMKYGFQRLSSGLGGKVKVTYTGYWEVPKIYGIDNNQWLSNGDFTSQPNVFAGIPPTNQAWIAFNLSDFTTSLVRNCAVSLHITQYGRWEGQQADLN